MSATMEKRCLWCHRPTIGERKFCSVECSQEWQVHQPASPAPEPPSAEGEPATNSVSAGSSLVVTPPDATTRFVLIAGGRITLMSDRIEDVSGEDGVNGQRAFAMVPLAKRDALAADAKRLDWLEAVVRDPRCVSLEGNPPQGLRHTFAWTVHRNGIGHGPWKETARDAIDAAMLRAERGTEPK